MLLGPSLFLCLLGAAQELQTAREPIAIHGGEDDRVGRYPTAVLVTANGQACSGVLLSPSSALSAAHCLTDVKFGQQVAVFVDTGSDVEVSAYLVESYALHPDYCRECDRDWFDFAVLELRQPVEEDVGAFPTLITDLEDWNALAGIGSTVTAVGFGDPQDRGRRVRRFVEVTVDSHSPSGHDLSFVGGPGACKGDSGAPLFVMQDEGLAVVGVYSRKEGSDCPGSRTMRAGATTAAACWLAELGYADEPGDPAFCQPDPDREPSGCAVGATSPPGGWCWILALAVLVRTRRA